MANLFEPPRYIAVEGPIRVGKSTLCRVIAETLHAQRISEPENNPFLRGFYQGETGAAFQAQFAFLIARYEQLGGLEVKRNPNKTYVADLVIYLQATPEVLKKRLKKKGAPGEKTISDDYLEEVIKAYEHFFFHYTSSDLLIVNTSEIDFVERSEDLQALLRRVSEPIRGTQYFLPLGPDEQTARA
jgi:deoxyadenosine/deoxycytidine kinase